MGRNVGQENPVLIRMKQFFPWTFLKAGCESDVVLDRAKAAVKETVAGLICGKRRLQTPSQGHFRLCSAHNGNSLKKTNQTYLFVVVVVLNRTFGLFYLLCLFI